MKCFNFVFIIIFFIMGCSSWKEVLVSQGDQNDAIHNAIIDFMHTCSLRKQDSIFSVSIYIDNDSMWGVSILGENENKIFPRINDKIGTYSDGFPSRYIILEKKLFFWEDSTYQITQEIIDALVHYNHIDSMNVNGFIEMPNYVINDSKKAADYYFCKNNLRNYKKVVTNVAMDWYPCPKLDCNKPIRKGK